MTLQMRWPLAAAWRAVSRSDPTPDTADRASGAGPDRGRRVALRNLVLAVVAPLAGAAPAQAQPSRRRPMPPSERDALREQLRELRRRGHGHDDEHRHGPGGPARRGDGHGPERRLERGADPDAVDDRRHGRARLTPEERMQLRRALREAQRRRHLERRRDD